MTLRCNIKNLQKVIAKVISTLPHVGTEIPKVWADVRGELYHLQKEGKPHISYEDYLRICQKYQMDEERAEFLSDFFHDLGIFLRFRDNSLLKRSVFLNNEWVTHGVYKVLDDKQVIDNYGKFSHTDLDRLWKGTAYARWEAEFIELMREFKICYPLKSSKTSEKFYLAPHRLPKDKPENLNWNSTSNFQFEYRYKFMPKGMLTWFIVEEYKNIYENMQWRYGVLLKIDNTFALVQEDYFNRKIIIRLRGKNKRDMLAIIRNTFENIHNDFNNLILEEMVPCNCSECEKSNKPYFYIYADLLKRRSKKKETIECYKSYEDVSITGLIETIKKSSRRNPRGQVEGKLFRKLTQAFLSAYPTKAKLTMMLRFTKSEKNLEAITIGDNLEETVFELLQTAEAEGWLDDLVLAVREDNSGNKQLQAVAQELGLGN